VRRIALGLSYSGQAYEGWQSQLSGQTLQDALERALAQFTQVPIRTLCAGRTDTGVHALQQVVHFDCEIERDDISWVRGTNRYLPKDMAVEWAKEVPESFHARRSALTRRYAYWLLNSPVRPSLGHERVGWVFRPLNLERMQRAAQMLLGTHDFTSFRAAQCQSPTPIKTLLQAHVSERKLSADRSYFCFEFEANAFLHHMIRNIVGCLVSVGQDNHPVQWIEEVLNAKNRAQAAPTFAPDGLYFLGPTYDPVFEVARVNANWVGFI
jgi:tRNA pseudouridine38-40 synthase